jgi:SAM-dependent methyltransferase
MTLDARHGQDPPALPTDGPTDSPERDGADGIAINRPERTSATTDSRYEIERAKWNAHAHARPHLDDADIIIPGDVTFESFAREKTLLRRMPDFIGPVAGRRVLEYGCGLGELTVLLARSGAHVTTFDLSADSLEVARRRAELNGVADRIQFVEASGEELPFADGSFEIAVGKAILHHLEPAIAAPELARILQPGGRAAFSEPLGINPLLIAVRKYVPYPGKHERGADRPLTRADLKAWARPFAEMQLEPIQLLAMVERGLGFGHRIPALRRADDLLFRAFPALGPLARYAFLLFRR